MPPKSLAQGSVLRAAAWKSEVLRQGVCFEGSPPWVVLFSAPHRKRVSRPRSSWLCQVLRLCFAWNASANILGEFSVPVVYTKYSFIECLEGSCMQRLMICTWGAVPSPSLHSGRGTLLLEAAKTGDDLEVKMLLEYGADKAHL